MKKDQNGFTLVELMIVITIIGILSIIAMSVYTIYTKRTHVSEGLILSEEARISVLGFYNANSRWPVDNTEAGISPPAAYATTAVRTIEIKDDKITVIFTQAVNDGETIEYVLETSGGSTAWDCTGGTLLNLYRPSSCK